VCVSPVQCIPYEKSRDILRIILTDLGYIFGAGNVAFLCDLFVYIFNHPLIKQISVMFII
jgi:hypothetical protein